MATDDFSGKALENLIKNTAKDIQQEFVNEQLDKGISKDKIKLMDYDVAYEKALKEITKDMKTFNDAIKANIKELKNQDVVYKQLANSAKQVESNMKDVKQNFWQRMGFKTHTEDDLTTQYRARQRAGAIETILGGNVLYGLQQFGSTIPKVANFMNTGLYTAMVGLSKATLQAIDAFYKFKIASDRISGGSTEELKNRYQRSFEQEIIMRSYGQKGEDLSKFLAENVGYKGRHNIYANTGRFTGIAEALGFTQASFKDIGANPEKVNELLAQERSLGLSESSMKRFNYRIVETAKSLDKLSSEKFINSYTELNKTLIANNINGMASAKMFEKFQDQLNKGTLSVADFTRGLTSRRESETSTLAGVGAMLAERGLGGKELQEAYARGDMIAVAGAVRRGGASMQRDIEKIAPEIAKTMGTSDWKEALALQSGTPWGQLTGNLKNLEVQNILINGGSLMAALEDSSKATKEEQAKLDEYAKKLVKDENQNKNIAESIKDAFVLALKGYSASLEKNPINTIANTALGITNPLALGTKLIIENNFSIGSSTTTTQTN